MNDQSLDPNRAGLLIRLGRPGRTAWRTCDLPVDDLGTMPTRRPYSWKKKGGPVTSPVGRGAVRISSPLQSQMAVVFGLPTEVEGPHRLSQLGTPVRSC